MICRSSAALWLAPTKLWLLSLNNESVTRDEGECWLGRNGKKGEGGIEVMGLRFPKPVHHPLVVRVLPNYGVRSK